MVKNKDQTPAGITLPNPEFRRAVRLFESDGLQFEDVIQTDPRGAYELFGSCVAEALLEKTTSITSNRLGDSVKKDMDGKAAFESIGRRVFSIMPELGDDERDVIINVTKMPFWATLRGKRADPKVIKNYRVYRSWS